MKLLTLENHNLKALFDPSNGALVELSNKQTGWKIQNRPELGRSFILNVPLPERLLNVIDGDTQHISSVQQSEDLSELVFTWNSIESQHAGRLDIILEGTVSLNDDGLTYNMRIENNSPYVVESVAYPYIGDLPKGGKAQQLTRGSFVYCNMVLKSLYPEFQNERGYWGVEYPVQMVPTPESPFVLILSGEEGLYAGCHDVTSKERVEFTFQVKPGHTKAGFVTADDEIGGKPACIEFMTMHHPFVQPQERYELSTILLKPFKGDWHAGADIYKSWRKTWMQDPASPDWAHEIHAWQQIQMSSWGDSLNIKYNELIDYAKQCEKHGVKAIQLTGWTLYGQDGRIPIHDIDQRLGTWDELKATIKKIQDSGVKVVLYEKFTCVDVGTDWYQEELCKYTSKDILGNIHGHGGWQYDTPAHLSGINTRPYAWMCMNSKEWQDIAISEIEKTLELEPDGILLDESMWHGTNAFYCFDETHGHRIPAYNFAGDTFFERKLRKLLDSKKTKLIFAGEGPYDFQNRHYNLTYHRVHPGHIPAIRYIDSDLPMMNWVFGYDDRENINMCLLYKYIISYEPRHFRGALEEFPLTLEYGKKVDHLRNRYKEYLWDATFQDTLGASVISQDRPIIYSVFITKDSKKSIVIANHNEENVQVTAKTDDGNSAFMLATPEKQDTIENNGELEISARSVAVIMEV